MCVIVNVYAAPNAMTCVEGPSLLGMSDREQNGKAGRRARGGRKGGGLNLLVRENENLEGEEWPTEGVFVAKMLATVEGG